jgi:4,5-DOPA dioxygenase extradiol
MERMPVLFVGHGNPMNAIEDNEFSREWIKIGKELPTPQAILCISAHWLTRGTWVTSMANPETIHDFVGFPEELFKVKYNAPGTPEFAGITQDLVFSTVVQSDTSWGLDHGTWSVLVKMFPKAEIPVFQLSIDVEKPARFHYQLGRELTELRKQGVLIIGSGNIVHNLGQVIWKDTAHDWAVEFDQKIKEKIALRSDIEIIDYDKMGAVAKLSVPSTDHFYPLLYVLGASEKSEPVTFYTEKCTMGSLSMRTVKIGN